jgi:chromosome segregation protein
LNESRQKSKNDSNAAHQLALRMQSLNSKISSVEQAMARLSEQEGILQSRKAGLEGSIRSSEEPQGRLKTELDLQLDKRLAVETQLATVRQKN